ncbi:S-layer homology domain-containing protein [Paenibacillus frigoriresistens]|uniref:S-layer homology domain-containing protein n=1 Tax=Paenibacillus alginolyticus TaxID=59839 RepID=UPI0015656DB5|nr:S-layer homology domain-containing protein [Paenibacillus frigoriresistens]NRF95879.1 S-layer homology domain-containing protein [Paenibacillus frigoriresistens]
MPNIVRGRLSFCVTLLLLFTTFFASFAVVNQPTVAYAATTTHTVTFNSNGGSAVNSQTVNDSSTATQPADPMKAGYTLGGWYSDSGLTTAFDFTTLITADTTLYAKWFNASPSLIADTTDADSAQPIELTFADTAWRAAITAVKDGMTSLAGTDYTVSVGKITINAGVLSPGSHTITITANGYSDATVVQTVSKAYLGEGNLPAETVYTGTDVTFLDTRNNVTYDDEVSDALPIGFDFYFYGTSKNQKYDHIYASTNGLLMFSNPSSTCCVSTNALPLSDPNHYITPFYRDLYLDQHSKVMYTTIGSPPNRKFVIQYTNMKFCCGDNGDPLGTFQVILYESTNEIQLQYPNLIGIGDDGDGGYINNKAFGSDALIGIQSLTGNYVKYSQATDSINEKQAIRFSPNTDLSSYTMSGLANYEPILLNNGSFPDSPVLVSPAYGSFASLTPTFHWNDANGAASYRLLIATDPEFLSTSIVMDQSIVKDQSGITPNSFDMTGLQDGTTYYWKVVAINDTGHYTFSNTFSFVATSKLPATVDTDANVTSITSTTATAGGNVTSDGGGTVTERGVIYSLNANPTISDGKVAAASGGTGTFSVNLTGLQPASTYHLRAYAVNEIGVSYGSDVTFTTLSSNANLTTFSLSGIKLDQTVSGGVYAYTASVPNNVTVTSVTYTTGDSYSSVELKLNGNPISNPINLNVGLNVITILVTAQDNSQTPYTVKVTRAAATSGGAPSTSGGAPSTTSSNIVTSTDGKLTVPVGKSGEVSLGDTVTISIPADASSKELKLTIEKLSDTLKLLTNKDGLASPVFEILKNFSENFSKPVTLTFAFDTKILKGNQKASVFYYDEEKKSWVEVGGKVNGDHISVEVNHFTKYAVFAVGQSADVPIKQILNFSDISGHWAEAGIKQAVSSGIVSGYPDGKFKPNATVTRSEFAVMLMNALKPQGEGTVLTFTDTAKIGAWAQKAVAQAVQAGIIKGYEDGSFRPDAEITRPEMAAMIANALGQPVEANTLTGFADDKDIPAWAKGAVAAMKKLGIIEGKGTNEFAPGDQTTRAEAVTVLLKMLAQKSK